MSFQAVQTSLVEGIVSARLNGDSNCFAAESPAIRSLNRVVAGIACTDIPLLIVGESGSGKQILAAEIHRRSRQSYAPFVHVSCAALTVSGINEWVHSLQTRPVEETTAHGTIYLDEISDLEPGCQAKLLLALPAGNGLPSSFRIPHRVISSTRKDLESEMRQQHFREELYYRINGACLRLPPLRHRKEDIPLLIRHFLIKYAATFGRSVPELSPRTLSILEEYGWPGNVRELENVVRKIVALQDEGVALGDLAPESPKAISQSEVTEGISLKRASRKASLQAERELILKALGRTRWNRKRAAEELKISYKALLYKLKQIGVDESPSS